MTIRLDGLITYPRDRADANTGQGSSKPRSRLSKSATCIAWEGSWRYVEKQPRGNNGRLGFKYYFVGPEIQTRSPTAGDSNSTVASNLGTGIEPKPNKEAVGGQTSPQGSTEQTLSGNHSAAMGSVQATAADSSRSTCITASIATLTPEVGEAPGHTQSPRNPDASSAVDGRKTDKITGDGSGGAVAADGSTKADSRPVQMSQYGPGGDGRLPSGTWRGQFAVKGRGADFMVSEFFVLEFGSGKASGSPAVSPNVNPPSSDSSSAAPTLSGVVSPNEATEAQPARASRTTDRAVVSSITGAEEGATPAQVGNDSSGATSLSTTSSTGAVTTSSTSTSEGGALEAAVISPVVRVSGWGQNRYGEFTLTGGHERATGRLDLNRYYLEKPRPPAAAASPVVRAEGAGVSHQKKRRSLPAGGPLPPPPGPSLAERRTKRTRCPNQRLLDDEATSNTYSEASGGGLAPGRRKSTGDGVTAVAASAAACGGTSGWSSMGVGLEGGGGNEPTRRGIPGPKPRKPRERERDPLMEQGRRARKRNASLPEAVQSIADVAPLVPAAAPPQGAAELAAAELAERARAGREALQGADLASLIGQDAEEDRVLKEALANMEKEQAGLEAEAAAAVAAAAAATAAATAEADAESAATQAALPPRTTEISRTESTGGGGVGPRSSRKSRNVAEERWRSISLDEETGEIYEGGMYRGKRHGQGMCVYANLNIYEGDWRHGKEHGIGQVMRPNRDIIYDGEFVDGKFCGRGRYVDDNGDVYEGDWKDSLRHGYGVYTFAKDPSATGESVDGKTVVCRYIGDFKDNMRCGRGNQTWAGGSYDGEWLNDAKHGRGVLRTSDGFMYDGGWVDDIPEGRGVCVHPDGQRYEGSFKGGKKEGRGTLEFANEASYEGRFRDDAIDGSGMLKIKMPVKDDMGGWMIPIQFQSDIGRIHVKAGFDKVGL